jgi:tetratricopeptide (TPR) repeat protein
VLPLPAVLVLADVLLRGKSLRAALRAQAPSLVLALGLGAAVVAIWSEHAMIRETAGGAIGAPARMAATLSHQLATALWPSANAPMYSTAAVARPSLLAWALLAALIALAFSFRRRHAQRALFTLAAFALLLLPVSNAVPMYFPYQDRYLSLPLTALGFGLGALIDGWRSHTAAPGPLAAGALLAFALALRTVQYQGEWSSEVRLWGHAASVQPDAYYAAMKLGEVRRKAGDLHGAIRAYRALVAIDPQRKLGHAALLASVALRDERLRGIAPSLADRYAEQFYGAIDDARALRELARRMLLTGHVRAMELPLARALEIEPLPDQALERAAAVHFAEGRPSIGWFFLQRMQKPTEQADLRAAGERERLRQVGSGSPL